METRHAVRIAALLVLGVVAGSCTSEESPAPVITTHYALRDDLRQLWTAQATWTRVMLVATVAELDETPHATQRLVRNEADIGEAFRPFFGGDAAYRLTALLTDHVTATREVIAATMAADNAALEAARTLWYANADDLARFLADLSPEWNYYELWRLFSTYLDHTMDETMARVSGDWDADVAADDAVVRHAQAIADVLADGITAERPDLVSPRTFTSSRERDLHVSMRVLWEDHAAWMRFYLIDSLAGLPSTPETSARLFRNQGEIGNEIRQYYGNPAADELTALLNVHVEGMQDVVAALAVGDSNEVGLAQARWYANATEIARFFENLDPSFSFGSIEMMMYEHLDQTTDEAIARTRGDWEGDIAAYDLVVAHILHFSDVLATGMATDESPVVFGI